MNRTGRPPALNRAQDAKLAVLYPELRNADICAAMGLTSSQIRSAVKRLGLKKSDAYLRDITRRPRGYKKRRSPTAIPSTYAEHPQPAAKPMRFPLIERCPQRNHLAGVRSIFDLAQRFAA